MKVFSKKSVCFLLLITLVLSMTLAGCQTTESESSAGSSETAAEATDKATEKSAEKPELRIAHSWGGGDSKAEFFEPLLDQYVEEHKDEVDISIEVSTGEDLKTKIKVDLAGDNMPDLFTFWGASDLRPLVEAGAVVEVEDYISKSENFTRDMIDEGSWAHFSINGGTYGIPMENYLSGFFVNSELFEQYGLEYPTTYEELIDVSAVFNENGIVPFSFGSKAGNPAHFFFSEVLQQYEGGTQEIYDFNNLQFATDNTLQLAELLVDMKANGIYPEDTIANGDWGPAFALYNEGKAAMTYTYPWMMGQMNEEMEAKTDIIPIPAMPGTSKDPSTFVAGSTVFGFVISQKSFSDPVKTDALVDLADFMVSEDVVIASAKGSALPANVAIDVPAEYFSPLLYRVMEYAIDLEKVPTHHTTCPTLEAYTAYTEGLDELLAGVITPQGFVDKVQTVLDEAE